jgi:hypothetical protein
VDKTGAMMVKAYHPPVMTEKKDDIFNRNRKNEKLLDYTSIIFYVIVNIWSKTAWKWRKAAQKWRKTAQ